MRAVFLGTISLRAVAALLGCSVFLQVAAGSGLATIESGPEFSGGATTVFDSSRAAFGLAARNMPAERRSAFFVGNSFFNENWVAAPASTAARDGLGPLFNARSCSACHLKDGRSRPPDHGGAMTTMLLRVSVPGRGPHGGPLPDPIYGDQFQGGAIPEVPAEADVLVEFESVEGAYADGERFALRRPRYRIANPRYGPPSAQLQMSGRVAPAMIGLGLLEAIPARTLERWSDPDDRDSDGISGRVNRVWDLAKQRVEIGRFGWKAEQPSVHQQVAGAFLGDMGLSTPLIRASNHTPKQTNCSERANGGDPEVSADIFDNMVYYSRTLAVPARRDWTNETVLRGQTLFAQARCSACHIPETKTGDWKEFPELSRQTIRPYTDLLLHDLGEGLADHRPAFDADGREWRTAPLWGLGLVDKVSGHLFLLHDGRARGFAEAILWHGGEAESSKEAFRKMPKRDREALLTFLQSL